MSENPQVICPACDDPLAEYPSLDRRHFIHTVGGGAAALLVGGATASAGGTTAAPTPRLIKPAENLIHELFRGMSAEQKTQVVYPWNHGGGAGQLPVRLRMSNSAYGRTVSQVFTPPQQELVQRILRAISADDDSYRRVLGVLQSDTRGGLGGAAANIFGDPSSGQYAWVLTAHHLTLRCDGNSEPDAAFGGPMYYGHSPDGYSARNAFNAQTRSVVSLFDGLNEDQRRRAVLTGTPGEQYRSVQHRNGSFPGVSIADLSSDQRRLVTSVMRDILSPYRKADSDEVMEILWRNGGLKRMHLAFYGDRNATDNRRWHFWRLEGPGFVWNYRVLPHVHCYVNIAAAR
ncbi:MAG: DUF3500 domain-containing protein [Planctomycetes bacterium]|nr:DUF3500 domain-containing protein [Planctomycetota bacterium]